MKTFTRLFSSAIIALVMTACGSANNNGYQNGQQVIGYNANGTPIYGNGNQTGYGAGGCVSLQGALSFTVQGPQISPTDILAGMLPANSRSPGQKGQVIMGGAVQTQQYGYGASMMLTKQSSNGTMQLQVMQGSMTGNLQLSPTIIQQLSMSAGGGYNTGYSNICVSSVAIDAVYTPGYSGQGYINQALVYLYLSNSQQPIGPIPFY